MDSVTQLGDWKKISVLGSGAFGIVVLFKNVTTSDFVAIKLCKFSLSSSLTEKQKQRWQNEVLIMKSLHHENIIKFKAIPHDLEASISKFNTTKLPLLSMEYCSKGNLRHVLHDTRNLSGLSETDVRFLLSDIRNGLEYLHSKKVTHRDLKPDNIVLQSFGARKTDTIYKIIDLGYAKELNGDKVSFVGTLDYLAPEIFQTQNYTSAVDYWSFGVLTFEVICGVLPFLAGTATPFERFELIRNKKPEDIFIYKSNSGLVTYSAELKKEHQISSCLAENLKCWLRRVLHYDPTVRAKLLPNNLTVLQCLKTILSKRIVQVFYVYKLEFYSYEFNDYTVLSTVRDWISRDVQVNKNDLILMSSEEMFGVDDKITLNELFHTDLSAPIMYVMRKGSFVDLHFNNIPNLIKIVASGKQLDLHLARQFNVQIVYFITNEKLLWNSFYNAFTLYEKYVRFLSETVEERFEEISNVFNTIQSNIVCCNKLRLKNICDNSFKCNAEYVECLNCFQRLAASLERTIEFYGRLKKKIANIKMRQVLLNGARVEIEKCLHKWTALHMYENVMQLFHKEGTKGIPKGMAIKELIQIVSQVVKGKSAMFHDKSLMECVNVMEVVISSSTVLLSWMQSFLRHLNELANAFDRNEINYHNIVIRCAVINNSVLNNNFEWCNKSAEELIQLNRNTRSAFSHKIEEFHASLRNTLKEISDL